MKTKNQYINPTVTVVAFKVEGGFNTSPGAVGLSLPNPPADYNSQGQQNWETPSSDLFDRW